jgi:hypothetical protein
LANRQRRRASQRFLTTAWLRTRRLRVSPPTGEAFSADPDQGFLGALGVTDDERAEKALRGITGKRLTYRWIDRPQA